MSKDSSGKTVESGTMFLVNPSMTHEKLKIVIGMIKKDDKSPAEQAPPEPPVERKHVVDAAIVRVIGAVILILAGLGRSIAANSERLVLGCIEVDVCK